MIDIETVKEEVPIEEALEYYGSQASSWAHPYGGWRAINCPFCSDSNGSGSVNASAGRFLCHQCGAPRDGRSGDVVDVVKYAENISETRTALEWIERNLM